MTTKLCSFLPIPVCLLSSLFLATSSAQAQNGADKLHESRLRAERALYAFRRGDYRVSAREYERITQADAEDATAWLRLASSRLRLNDEEAGKKAADQAIELFEARIAENPWDGSNFFGLAVINFMLERFDAAIAPAERSVELGFDRMFANPFETYGPDPIMVLPILYAEAGRKEEALAALRRAAELGFNGSYDFAAQNARFEKVRAVPGFEEIARVSAPKGKGRDEGWQYDLNLLEERLERSHSDLFDIQPREVYRQKFAALREDVPALTDMEIALRIGEIISPTKAGHTQLLWETVRGNAPGIPLLMDFYAEGMRIWASSEEQQELIGSEVLAIGMLTPEELLAGVGRIAAAENEQFLRLIAPNYLRRPAILQYLGACEDLEFVELTLRRPGGEVETVEIESIPTGSSGKLVRARDRSKNPEPLYLQDRKMPYWLEFLPEDGILYWNYNSVRANADEPPYAFSQRLIAEVEEERTQALVLDIRKNGGGDTSTHRPIVEALIACEKLREPNRFFVIIGRNTYSAAMNFCTDLDQRTAAIFVGEPTGASPNFIGERVVSTLPCRGLKLSISTITWGRSHPYDTRKWIAPDLPVPKSFVDYEANRDGALEAIRERLAR
ncbi:MAG: hypothetical protein ACYTG5_10230 [Planctomycetota bacterium]|jgi:tetratricopeptide (TPR) repeat protein